MSHKTDQMRKHSFAPQDNRILAPQIRRVSFYYDLLDKTENLMLHKSDRSSAKCCSNSKNG
jgi:hypothetical protein